MTGERTDRRPGGDVVLFLPACNEEPRIGAVLERFPTDIAGRSVTAVVVDDGSTDATAAVAATAGATVVSLGRNRGLGAAVRAGLAFATGRGAAVVAFCDADGEYDPQELESLVRPILDGEADYVVGSRFAGGVRRMRPHRAVGNRALTRWVRRLSGWPVTDGQSGYRALSATAAAAAEIAHDYNYAQVLTLDLAGKGFRYAEVPITYRRRTTGRSFVRLGPYLRNVVPTVRAQTRRHQTPQTLEGCRVLGGDNPPKLGRSPELRSVLHDEAAEGGPGRGPAVPVEGAVGA